MVARHARLPSAPSARHDPRPPCPPTPVLSVDEIDFADPIFWAHPLAERDAAFATLRAERPLAYHPEFEIPGLPKGPGYWSLVRHDHVTLASRQPDLLRSGQGTQIMDQPAIFNEAFGSMINMDDPRHERLRRIVSGSFTPRMLKRAESQVQEAAEAVIDAVAKRGACDFVTDIAAAGAGAVAARASDRRPHLGARQLAGRRRLARRQ